MESDSLPVSDVRKTRSQVANEKRIADEQLKQKAELKRRKKMFTPRKVIGPRDILVNSNLPKIKLEEDVGSSSFVKQETEEVEPTSMENFSVNNQFIQPCANSADNAVVDVVQNVNALHADEESKDNLSSIMSIKSEDNQVLQKHVELLKVLVDQKDQEINVLSEVVERLQLHLLDLKKISIVDDPKMDDDTPTMETGILNLPLDKQVAELTCDLTSKDIRIKMLTTTMINLQNELLDNTNNSFQSTKGSRTSEKIVQETFKQVLPILYHELELKDLLACRGVCQLWQNTIDTYLNNHPSKILFEKKTNLEEFRQLEIGCIPKWNESPLTQLAKIYTFSKMRALENFTKTRKGFIIGSTVSLVNIIPAAQLDDLSTLIQFLEYFGSKINYIVIRQCVELYNFNIAVFMDHLKICLGKLPNLKRLSIVFCIDGLDIQQKSGWSSLESTGKAAYKNWHSNFFPKLENLESLVLDVDIKEGMSVHANFLRNFSKSLIKPYQKQLRRVSMFAHEIGPSEGLILPNLVQLAIPQRYLGQNAELGCKNVEKCTMTSCVYLLTHDIILVINRLFPKLVSLGFRFEFFGGKLENLYWTPFAPKLFDLTILELENCGGVLFNVLSCFPNVRYIKLINNYSDDVQDFNDENVLNITKLWQGGNLYELRKFWDTFPNISVVTLEVNGEPSKMWKSKICTWTRDGYNHYWQKNKFDDFLQSIL